MWEKVKLGDHLDILSGFAFKSSLFTDDKKNTPIIRIRDIKRSFTETFYKGDYNTSYLINKGDFIIGMDGEFNIAEWHGIPSLLNQRVCKISSRNKQILNEKYVFFIISKYLKEIEDKTSFVTVKHLSINDIRNIEILLPPLPIQEKIANILDKADALRRKDQELQAKYDELAQAIFIDMFGDPIKNEKGWEVKNIESLVKKEKNAIKRGPFGGALKKEIFVDSGYLIYEQFHALNNDFSMERYFIDEKKYQELIGFKVNPKDIIISCSGVYLGKLAIVPENAKPGIINQALLKLTLDEDVMLNKFFVFHFTQPFFREKYFDANRGAGIPNFPPMSEFRKFPFICPPISDQQSFAKKIELINELKEKANSTKSEELFQSLLQRAFRGELVDQYSVL